METNMQIKATALTDGRRAGSRVPGSITAAAGYYRLTDAVADQHNIVVPYLHILIVRTSPDVDYIHNPALPWRCCHGLADGGVIAAAVSRHHGVHWSAAHREAQEPPFSGSYPERHPIVFTMIARCGFGCRVDEGK